MKYSVVLQDPFDFAAFWILIGIGALLASAAVWMTLRYRLVERVFRRRRSPYGAIMLFFRRLRCLRGIRRIGKDFNRGMIDSREAHQRMSREVRAFAEAVTGAPVTHMVLSELPRLSYPGLTDLIGELYEPEFSRRSTDTVDDMIRRSEELIRRWR